MSRSTRERILDAAQARFAEKGYAGTAMSEIAEAVGIRTPSIYKHFQGKQALYEAVMERLLDPYFETLYHMLEVPLDAEQAERNLMTVAETYVRSPHLARLVQHAAMAGGEEVDLLLERWFEPFFQRAAEMTMEAPYLEGRDPRETMLVVMAFHSLICGYVTLAPLHRRMLGEDPLDEDMLERQTRLLRQMARALWQS